MADVSNISGNVHEPVLVLGPGEEEGTTRIVRLGPVEELPDSELSAASYKAAKDDAGAAESGDAASAADESSASSEGATSSETSSSAA